MDEDISKFRSPDGSTDSDVSIKHQKMMSLLGAGGGFWGEVEQAEAGEPHGESINQGQLERLLRPAVEDEITYKQIVCLKGGCSSVQCEDRSMELSLE